MKKFLALLLMFTFAVAPVVGCGGDAKKDEKKGTEEKKDAGADKKDAAAEEKKDAK